MPRPVRIESFLANLPLFAGLDAGERARLAAGCALRRLRRGDVLFREGEQPDGFHAVVVGRLKLASRGPARREHVIGLVEPGESFGEPVMFLGKPYLVTATALADSLVLHVGREAVLAEIARNPGFATRVIGALAARTESLVRELQAQALGSASQRFVAWLLRDPALRAESGAATLRLPASKRLLAARLNCSAEHLSRILHDLSEAGLLAVHGRDLTVPAVERLRERSPPLR